MTTLTAGPKVHGNKNAYYKRKCRCDVCEAWHESVLSSGKREPNFTHGTPYAFYHMECRCDDCQAWHGRPKRGSVLADWVHGTKHSYYNRKCRCGVCEAWHDEQKVLKLATKGFTHGSHYAWYTRQCRCDVCIEWGGDFASRNGHGSERTWSSNGCRCEVCQAAFPERALTYRSTDLAKRSTSRPERAVATSNLECLNVHPVTGERCTLDRHHEHFRSVECVATDVNGVPLRWKAPASLALVALVSHSAGKVAA